ncbi:MAG TPA: ferredoxin reductase [Solirubrobacteraceae bacterium]|jgi:ferredoxin-NADP reductase
MAERGATPQVPQLQRTALKALRWMFTPLLPDDYLELINPLWSTQELRGKIVDVKRETDDAVTVTIKPGWNWPGHEPGQYLRIGVVVDGVHHWRAYSLTSEPGREDGCISITPKLVPEGKVSPFFVEKAADGCILRLGGVEGTFTLPDPLPEKLLFISAGSGVTPIMSMIRDLARRDALTDAMLIHSARHEGDVIFGKQLRQIASEHEGFRIHEQHTDEMGRMEPADLDRLCPDWRERETFISGPPELLEGLEKHWEENGGDDERLHAEHFQPTEQVGDGEHGDGGAIKFIKSDEEAESDGSQPILVAGEEAGLSLPFGCRMGICHTCVGKLVAGQVRDLRTGEVKGSEGEMVRTCINAPEGAIEIEL